MIRIRQQVRLLASEDLMLQICLNDSLHRTAGYSCQLFNISGTFAGPRLSSWLHISSATRSIFCSVLTVLGRPLPAFREIEFIVSILSRRSLSELTAHFFKKNSSQNMFCTPSLFLIKEFNRRFIFVRERHVYQQTVT